MTSMILLIILYDNYYYCIYYSLRWYILGKHSDLVFTENTNTEGSLETSLLTLDDHECLTSQIFNDVQHPSEFENTAVVEGQLGTMKTVVSTSNFDLLKQFEAYIKNS